MNLVEKINSILEITEPKKLDADRGSVIKVKNTKWEVFRKVDDYTFWVYKDGTKKRHAYELVAVGGEKYEVWQTGGSGQRLKKKPDVLGKAEVV